MVDGPVSRIEWVEEQLRHALLNGELRPGERLLTAQLSERLQVSPTPLREALHRFAGEGLVEFIPQRGARVTELSAEDSAELTELRLMLEPRCVSQAIEHREATWSDEISASSQELSDSWGADAYDVRSGERAYREFYAALTRPCRSTRLKRFTATVRDQDARYRIATIGQLDRAELIACHRRLVAAALGGDRRGAVAAIREEIETFASGYAAMAGS